MRLGAVAKTFSIRPSDYFPELGTYERFCLDEAVAYFVASKEAEQIEQAKNKEPEPSAKQTDFIEWMNSEKFRAKEGSR